MKKINAIDLYSIAGISENCILGKSGTLSFVYTLSLPPYLSLDKTSILDFEEKLVYAFKSFDNVIIHRQDFFFKEKFNSQLIRGNSFLQKSVKKHFEGREYIQNLTLFSFSLQGLNSLEKAYIKSPLNYKDAVSIADFRLIETFQSELKDTISKINSVKGFKIVEADKQTLSDLILYYSNGLENADVLHDLCFEENIKVNNKVGQILSICDETHLPDEVAAYTKNKNLFQSILEDTGVTLKCDHIINQIWILRGKDFEDKLNKSILQHRQYQSFDKTLKIKADVLEESQQKIALSKDRICLYNQNILFFAENENKLNKISNEVKALFSANYFKVYQPTYEYLYNLFTGCIIGRENKINNDFFFLSTLEVSTKLGIFYSNFKGDTSGILYNGLIYQEPVYVDVWDERKKRIPARNAMIIASTGGGKSVSALNIVQQMIETNVKVIVVEFGKSFYQLCQLYPEKSFHVDYDTSKPLGINPFILNASIEKDLANKEYYSKIQTLTALVLKFWRVKEIRESTTHEVSVRTMLHEYYLNNSSDYSFASFYNFVKEQGEDVMYRNNIGREYFNLQSFLHVCREFLPGGVYQSICMPSALEDELQKKDFIVFELTKVKSDPFLVSVIMSILYDTIENKILSDKSQKGILFFDEYAETAQLKDNQNDNDIHSTVAFCYQKLRKENGAIYTIVQSPSQLPADHNTRNIISNTQILYVLPTTEVVYSDVIDLFKIQNEAHINLLKSIENNFSGERPYSQIYMRFQDKEAFAVKLELTREKFFAFQTEGEIYTALEEMTKSGYTLEEAIQKQTV